MAIIRWNPFTELESMQRHINRLFEERKGKEGYRDELSAFAPLVDIYETKDTINMDVELPGLAKEDVTLRIEDDTLIIAGERKDETQSQGKNYHRVERVYGRFSRSFSLPTNIDKDKVNASFKNGILKVSLPKKEEAKPKQIKIKVNE